MLGLSSKSAAALLFLFSIALVHAAPLATEKRSVHTSLRLARDEENLSQPTTVQTTNTIQTAVGPMLQTCTIKLEPITGDNGQPLVRETKSCSLSMTSSSNNASGSSGSNSGSNSGSSDSASSSADSAAPSQTDASATATATDGASSAPATTTGAIGVNGASEIPASALSTGATDSAAATATGASDSAQATATAGSGGGAVSAGGFSTIDKSAIATETGASASATPAPSGTGTAVGDAANTPTSATSAADTAESSPAATFQLPGTKLSVLPIGLGVFAGISVIALIVVGLVTYERTKYRKAFRQRKLAESGASMGYGGMA
ncbi:hypothetical protein BC628DRAFT_1413889 [Trametes gibbosa]|nr:hypothetical protein BC628DRAFT_1413889 [Trametes gibbosa]